MSFLWPSMLLSLAVIPAAAYAYVRTERRREARRRELEASALVITTSAKRLRIRRHTPAILFLTALTVLVVALARPRATLALPQQRGTVIIVIDVSTSMLADDVEPTRVEAAKSLARAFVEGQPDAIEIGVVAFGDGAQIVAAPTTDRGAVLAAIERLDATGGGTATAPGLFAALNAINGRPIPVVDESVAEQIANGEDVEVDLETVDIGLFRSAAILLFSDGENTGGADPTAIAQLAANAGVAINTVGVGTSAGAVIDVDGYQVATALDEETLRTIAETTGAEYVPGSETGDIAAISASIDLRWTREGTPTELTGPLAIIAILLLVSGAATSVRWSGRVI